MAFFALLAPRLLSSPAQLVRDLTDYKRSPDDRIALVLSGGGAKGIAHIPVIEMLEKYNIVPDYVIGTSMGALIGGLYASGMDSSQMAELVERENFVSLFSTYPPDPMSPYDSIDPSRNDLFSLSAGESGLSDRSGVIDDFRITSLFNRCLFPNGFKGNFDDLPIKYRAVAYDYNARERVVFSHGRLCEAMRASMGIPLVFQVYKIGEHGYLDGGLADNIPVSVAKDLGANIIITSDVSDKSGKLDNSVFTVGIKLLGQVNQTRYNSMKPEEHSTIYIEHDSSGFNMMSFSKAHEILERGRKTMAGFDSAFSKLKPGDDSGADYFVSETASDAAPATYKVVELSFEDVSHDKLTDVSGYDNYFSSRLSGYVGRIVDESFFNDLERDLDNVRVRLDLDAIGYTFEEVGPDSFGVVVRYGVKKPAVFRVSLMQNLAVNIFSRRGVPVAHEFDPSMKFTFDLYSDSRRQLANSFTFALRRNLSVSFGYELTRRMQFMPFYFQCRVNYDVGNFFNGGILVGQFFENYDQRVEVGADFFFDEIGSDISIGIQNELNFVNAVMRGADILTSHDALFFRMRGIFFDSRVPKIIKDNQFTIFLEAAGGVNFSLFGRYSPIPVYSFNLKTLWHQKISRHLLLGLDATAYVNRFSPSVKTNFAKYSYFNECFIASRLVSEYYGVSLSASYIIEQVSLSDMVFKLNLAWQQSDDASDEFEFTSDHYDKAEVLGGIFSRLGRKSLTLDFEVGIDTAIISVVVGGGVDFLSREWRIYVRL